MGSADITIAEQLDDEVRLGTIRDILNGELIEAGILQAILVDLSGNIIAQYDSGEMTYDSATLAVLAANNIGSLEMISRMIGEGDFSLFILKGKSDNIHFNRITNDLFLITIFNQTLSIGFIRQKIEKAVGDLQLVFDHCLVL